MWIIKRHLPVPWNHRDRFEKISQAIMAGREPELDNFSIKKPLLRRNVIHVIAPYGDKLATFKKRRPKK